MFYYYLLYKYRWIFQGQVWNFSYYMFVILGVFNYGPGAAVKLYNLTAASVHGPKQRNLRFTESQRQTREKQK